MPLNVVEVYQGKFVTSTFRHLHAIFLWLLSGIFFYLGARNGPAFLLENPISLIIVAIGFLICLFASYLWFSRTCVELVPSSNEYRVLLAGSLVIDKGPILNRVRIQKEVDQPGYVRAALKVGRRSFLAGSWGNQAEAQRQLVQLSHQLAVPID